MSHPDSGIYEKDGLGYISVSDVLGRTLPLFNPSKVNGLEYWQRNEPDAVEILKRGQQRGTFIHAEVELFLTGHNLVHKDDRPSYEQMLSHNIHGYMSYLSPLLDEIKKQNPCSSLCDEDNGKCSVSSDGKCHNRKHDLLIESPIYSPYGWAGTPDLRLFWDGIYSIWDWKSIRSHKEQGVEKKPKSISRYTEAYVQVGAYALAHNILAKSNDSIQPIKQGVICLCYDWREPHVHVLSKEELKKAANVFIERYKVYQEITQTKFPIKL